MSCGHLCSEIARSGDSTRSLDNILVQLDGGKCIRLKAEYFAKRMSFQIR